MRDAFSDFIVETAKADPRVLLLTGDHGYALFDAFRKACPNQYVNCGIAEQNMVGVAAGLAKAGFIPIVYGLAAFVPIRVLEQIKIDVCYEQLPVILIGDGAGVVYSHLGTSHQSTEDIAALRAVPHIQVYSPADRHELTACMQTSYASGSPAYIRMGKADLGDVHEGQVSVGAEPLPVINAARPNLAIATGSMVRLVKDSIEANDLPFDLVSVPSIKPMTYDTVRSLASNRGNIVVFEEHSKYGGLGSAIAEALIGHYRGGFKSVGVDDTFSERCGDYRFLMQEHGLAQEHVIAALTDMAKASSSRTEESL